MILSFRTGMPGQTVQTQIRLLLIWIYTVCHSVWIIWTQHPMVEPHSSNFRLITTNFLGVRIFRNFMVLYIKVGTVTVYHLIFMFFFYFTIYNRQFIIWDAWYFSEFKLAQKFREKWLLPPGNIGRSVMTQGRSLIRFTDLSCKKLWDKMKS